MNSAIISVLGKVLVSNKLEKTVMFEAKVCETVTGIVAHKNEEFKF